MILTNLSKLPMEKMQELVGKKVNWREETHIVIKVEYDLNAFGDVVGYKIYTDKDEFGFWYPQGFDFGLTLKDWKFPKEYMEDIKQASELEKKLRNKNDKRVKSISRIPVTQRIKHRYDEMNGKPLYRLHIRLHFSFDWLVVSDLVLKVGHDIGTIELPVRRSDNRTVIKQLVPDEIKEFFAFYESFDFYAPEPNDKEGLDGWDLFYTFCDGEANYSYNYWSPERNDKAWSLVEYAVLLWKKYLSPNEFECIQDALQRYTVN